MKKVLAIVVVLCVVFVAGTALAQPRRHDEARRMPMPPHGQHMPQHPDHPGPGGMPQAHCSPEPGHGGHRALRFAPDMPEEIRAKVVEAAKLRIDLEAAFAEKPINKAKALEIFAQLQRAENEIATWKFARKIERIEAFRAHREAGRPAHPAPHHHDGPEAPEAPVPEEPAPEEPAPEAPAE